MYSISQPHPIGPIAGDSGALYRCADCYGSWSKRLDSVGAAIKNIDPRLWEGAAAEAFRAVRDIQPSGGSTQVTTSLAQLRSIVIMPRR